MKRVVMSLAIETGDDEAEGGRAAEFASRTIRTWTRGDPDINRRIILLSARWETEDDPFAGGGPGGRASGV